MMTGHLSGALIKEAGGPGSARASRFRGLGWRRPGLCELRARARGARRGPAPSSPSSPASTTRWLPSPSAEFGTAAQKDTLAAAAGDRRRDRRVCALRGARRIRRGQPAVDRSPRRPRLCVQRPEGVGGQRRGGGSSRSFCRHAARDSRARRERVPRADRHAGDHARRASRIRWVCAVLAAWISSCTDVRVGADALLGTPGDGFQIAMWALDGGRVAIAAQALGVGAAALEEAIAHAKSHEAFGQPIANYQAIQWMLADIATELDAARLLTLKAADARSAARPAHARSSDGETLRIRSGASRRRSAMQILASHGYRRGSLVERLFRDVRAAGDLSGDVGSSADGHRRAARPGPRPRITRIRVTRR